MVSIMIGEGAADEDASVPALRPGTADWRLLLQIASRNDDSGMMWGDGGNLYVWIRRLDLAARDFSKVWVVLQCY